MIENNELVEEKEELTFTQKINNLFKVENGRVHPKISLVQQCMVAGGVAGMCIGGRIGARVGAVEHIETTKLEAYKSVTHAHRQYHGRVFLGFVRNGCKFGWRAGVFAGIYSMVTVVLSETTNFNDSVSLLGAGALTGVCYKALAGWRNMLVASLIGTGLSAPCAALLETVRYLAPEGKKSEIDVFKMFTYPEESIQSEEPVNISAEKVESDLAQVLQDFAKFDVDETNH